MLMLRETRNEEGEESAFLKNAKQAKTIRIFFENYFKRARPVLRLLSQKVGMNIGPSQTFTHPMAEAKIR